MTIWRFQPGTKGRGENPNGEIRMTIQIRNPNDEMEARDSDFVIRN